MQDDADASELRAFMAAKGLNETEMAERAHVSQATVSRAIKGGARKRRGRAYTRLFTYIHQVKRREGDIHMDKSQVLEAFDRVWGASKEHAAAMARVIDALDMLRPQQHQGVQSE